MKKITFRRPPPSNNPLERGETFFSKKHNPSARNFRWQQLAPRRTQPPANIKRSSSNAQPAALYILRTRNTNELCARKGGDIFPDLPLAHPSSGPNSTHEPEGYGRRFSYVHITEHLEGCTQQNISKDANRAPRRMHFAEHREGQIKSPKHTRLQ